MLKSKLRFLKTYLELALENQPDSEPFVASAIKRFPRLEKESF